MKRISTYTLGCKLNVAESSALAQEYLQKGYQLVPFGEKSDLTIINTCSVTEQANVKCRNVVRKALKASPEAFVAVVGCYAQLEPEALASIEGVDAVLGAKEKFEMASLLGDFEKTGETKILVSDIETVSGFGFGHSISLENSKDQTRAYLKVQDGCNYTCSYCTIPLARGKSRSESIDKIIFQANLLKEAGYQEIVLTGVNIGDFGNLPDGTEGLYTFFDLLKEIEKVEVPRIRISSIEPNLLTSEMIDFISSSKRIVPHFHLPMQSGSVEILKRMRRRYTKELYQERVFEVVNKIPNVCIGADVIVGFPGETDAHFEETFEFIQSLPISYLHVFTFSKRPNTNAAELIDENIFEDIRPEVKKARNQKLTELSYFKWKQYVSRFINQIDEVLFENEFSDDTELNSEIGFSEVEGKTLCFGHTPNYLRVGVEVPSRAWAKEHLIRKRKPVQLTAIDSDLNVIGTFLDAEVIAT
ncbi:MAG: tRNA (N(6)-L-threonylcarbamoyladenosine(37)-C(2))-methylthiotransferase MtaB [Chloroherpetonaceae bacterium]|nr:tRNA (N(6)-L-threonylcarbamoyladenosine(37)-C(2))-methylthiotransferase MtaB [Chloroherpetonaceae bacterium]